MWLFEPDRFFFSITNDRTTPASEIIFLANDRRDQENLIAQLKGGVKALAMPVGDLVSNWAYDRSRGETEEWSLDAPVGVLQDELGCLIARRRGGPLSRKFRIVGATAAGLRARGPGRRRRGH